MRASPVEGLVTALSLEAGRRAQHRLFLFQKIGALQGKAGLAQELVAEVRPLAVAPPNRQRRSGRVCTSQPA